MRWRTIFRFALSIKILNTIIIYKKQDKQTNKPGLVYGGCVVHVLSSNAIPMASKNCAFGIGSVLKGIETRNAMLIGYKKLILE